MNLFQSTTFLLVNTLPLLLLLLQLSSIQAQEQEKCNRTITTVDDFDIDTYASAPWYVHQQAENLYSPIEQNYCTTAQYTVRDSPTTPWGYTVDVFNQAQYENGITVEGNLCAYQTEESPSKLAVAPCFLPKIVAGPYWVVAYDESEGYALISGGQPEFLTENGLCSSGTGINNSGLWIFSRSQTRNETLVNTVRGIAEDAGFDLSVLNDVNQTSCDSCEDDEGTFRVGFYGQKDCDFIGSKWWGCIFFAANCPSTCELC